MSSRISVIIVPDIHGRSFWHQPAGLVDSADRIIFLGDYLDPYPWEDITERQAFNGLKDIVSLKRSHPDKVVLLLGNHDGHYLCDGVDCSRRSIVNSELFRTFFNDNIELFTLAHQEVIAGRRFLFSHAGVHPYYLREAGLPEVYTADAVNAMNLHRMLEDYGRRRGWGAYYTCGSPMWCDVTEWADTPEGDYPDDLVQVFGHTQLRDKPVDLYRKCYCLDIRRCFGINECGCVCEMNGEQLQAITEHEIHGRHNEM